jgi:hypothetical protein
VPTVQFPVPELAVSQPSWILSSSLGREGSDWVGMAAQAASPRGVVSPLEVSTPDDSNCNGPCPTESSLLLSHQPPGKPVCKSVCIHLHHVCFSLLTKSVFSSQFSNFEGKWLMSMLCISRWCERESRMDFMLH